LSSSKSSEEEEEEDEEELSDIKSQKQFEINEPEISMMNNHRLFANIDN
jgi:hypothetical protein